VGGRPAILRRSPNEEELASANEGVRKYLTLAGSQSTV
jgi:hypothetical protein